MVPSARSSQAASLPPVTLVDSNVLLDVLTQDPTWESWSAGALQDAADRGAIAIDQIIYAEVSTRFSRIEDCDDVLVDFRRESMPWPAAYLAARAHRNYRLRGGARTTTLPDFLIGAHAAVSNFVLLTRDAARYRTYFPTVRLICPD